MFDGPAADYGSLSAFFGVPLSQAHQAAGAHGAHGAAARGPRETKPQEAKDSTLLNKKVAFRMLKQLGCEVLQDEEMSYVEVSLAKQPVLFKMLVELGRGPCRNQEGDMVVRVKEQRPRRPEEVVAALSAPKAKAKEEEEGYPSLGLNRRLRPEDEEQLVKRLYVPPRTKSAAPEREETAGLPKPRRTAAEQRAYLDRLVKPREEAAPNEDLRDLEGLAYGVGKKLAWPKFSSPSAKTKPPLPKRRMGRGLSAPLVQAGQLVLSESPELEQMDSQEDREGERERRGLRDRRRGERAGHRLEREVGDGHRLEGERADRERAEKERAHGEGREAVRADAERRDAERRDAERGHEEGGDGGGGGDGEGADDERGHEERGDGEGGDEEGGQEEGDGEGGDAEGGDAEGGDAEREDEVGGKEGRYCEGGAEPEAGDEPPGQEVEDVRSMTQSPWSPRRCPSPMSPVNSAGDRGEKFDDESTDEWLERLLGACQPMPRRSAKEQRERLEQLAKPRQRPQRPQDSASAPTRSPRSQREACARLSQPRKPKDLEEVEVREVREMRQATPEVEEDEQEESEQDVLIIPSMLAQCSPRLERIDEEGSESGSKPRRRGPYSVPVCPRAQPVQSRRRRKVQQEVPVAQEELGAEVEGEAMLEDIDALYSQLMAEEPTPPEPVEAEPEVYTEPLGLAAQMDGEEILVAIDELFHQMLPDSKLPEQPEPEEPEDDEIFAYPSDRPQVAEASPKSEAAEAPKVKRRAKVRRTSLSHWTEESLQQLEAPRGKAKALA